MYFEIFQKSQLTEWASKVYQENIKSLIAILIHITLIRTPSCIWILTIIWWLGLLEDYGHLILDVKG